MTAITNQNGGAQPQINAPPHTDSVGDHDRNFKEESRRNKKLRFRKNMVFVGFRFYVKKMQRKSENPFQVHSDWHYNACVSNCLQFWEIGNYYVRAADALVQDTIEDSSLLDVYVSPLVFLYRHAVELFLKDLLWQSHYLAFGIKGFIKDKGFQTHDLLKLWQQLKKNCQGVLGTAFPLSTHDIEMLEQLLAQIQKHDPRSDAFRFPFDVRGNVSHASLSQVNVRSLYESVHQAVNSLGNLKEIVTDYYLKKSDIGPHRIPAL
jgi:hypothetical protein